MILVTSIHQKCKTMMCLFLFTNICYFLNAGYGTVKTWQYHTVDGTINSWRYRSQRGYGAVKTISFSLSVITRGVQKVRSLIQLTTEYEHDILSVFNIVPFDRNALGPAILQSLYAIVEEFLMLVLQRATRGADNIIVVSKLTSFHEFFSVLKQIKSLVVKSAKYDGWRSSLKPAVQVAVSACDDVWAGDDTAHRVATFLVSSLSVPPNIFQSDQRSMFL